MGEEGAGPPWPNYTLHWPNKRPETLNLKIHHPGWFLLTCSLYYLPSHLWPPNSNLLRLLAFLLAWNPQQLHQTTNTTPNMDHQMKILTKLAKLHLAYRWYRFCLQWGDINFIGLGLSVLRDSHQCLVLKFMISWRPKSDFILGQFCQTRARRSSSICRSSERWWRSSTILITYRSSMDTRSEVISLSKWRRQQLMWVKL